MSHCATAMNDSDFREEGVRGAERLEGERILAASTSLGGDRFKTDLIVPDMRCAGCIGSIERGIGSLEAVEEARANLSRKTVSITWNRGKGGFAEIAGRLESLGFDHHLCESTEAESESSGDPEARSLLLALAVAGFASANVMLLSVSVWSGADAETAQLFHLISGIIAVPAVAFSGRPFFRSALRALSAKRLNMDVPISLAVLLALAMSVGESIAGGEEAYFDASVTLLFFLLIGRYLDRLMRNKASGAVRLLQSLSAKDGVLVAENGEISRIPLKEIEPGMTLRVFPGERFPVNGFISSGESDLDCSHVTGESDPLRSRPGMAVEAGTLNLTGAIDFRASATSDSSFLGEMRRMMEAAEKGRGAYVRIADRMARIYAPGVHLLSFLTFIGWMISTGGDLRVSAYAAIAVLIITCPCALGLAVPVAHVIGANRLMRRGIMMRDGSALERLASIDCVVFDKTGTLTTDRAFVVEAHGLDEESAPAAKALASVSNHPYARAVDEYLAVSPLRGVIDPGAPSETPGFGVESDCLGVRARFGRPDWVSEIASSRNEGIESRSVSFALEGHPMIDFVIEDNLRDGAREAIESLEEMGLRMEILSGDRLPRVSRVAEALGISRFSHRRTPSEKIERIRLIQEGGGKALMVGDGINDAPALSSGHVSMAPASASDLGRHAADFVFIRGSLDAVPFAVETARATERVVWQNFGLALGYNAIAVPLAVTGYVTPLFAALAMSLSSLAVALNSFRLGLPRADERFGADGVGVEGISEVDGISGVARFRRGGSNRMEATA